MKCSLWKFLFIFLALSAQASNSNTTTRLLEERFKELFTPGTEGEDWFSPMAFDGHHLRLIKEGPQVLNERLRLILTAKRSVLFSTFQFGVDETSEKIALAMCQMGRKGIDVRMMVDFYGSDKFYRQFADRLRRCNVGIIKFSPASWGLEKTLKGMHEKLLIIDGETVYMGSRGVNNAYHHVLPAKKFFHDLDIIIQGPVACWWHMKYLMTFHRSRLNSDECFDFKGCRPRPKQIDELLHGKQTYTLCRPVTRGMSRVLPAYGNPVFHPKKTPIEDIYIKALQNLEMGATVKLYAPYFVPTKRFGAALIKAKNEKRAQISVITNSIASIDVSNDVLAAMGHEVGYLLKAGINIRLYPGPLTLHRKTGVFGGKYGHVGSDNFDNRGQHHQTESVIFTDDEKIVREIESEFDYDYEQTIPLTPKYVKKIHKRSTTFEAWYTDVFRDLY